MVEKGELSKVHHQQPLYVQLVIWEKSKEVFSIILGAMSVCYVVYSKDFLSSNELISNRGWLRN